MFGFVSACACVLAVSAPPPPAAAPAASPRFAGAFIQYWNPFAKDPGTRLSREEWDAVLTDMQSLGMEHVVIQHTVWLDKDGKSWNFFPQDGFDATTIVLDLADEKGLKVWVGLLEEAKELWNDAALSKLAAEGGEKKADADAKVAETVWKWYEKDRAGKPRKSFHGWYLPLEPWNFTEDEHGKRNAALNAYYTRLAKACKKIASKPVAMCAYFTPPELYGDAPPKETAANYKQVLKGVPIDLFMVQDGAGAKGDVNWPAMKRAVPEYFAAFQEACDAEKIPLWGNLECYATKDGVLRPAGIDRLKEQFAAAQPPAGKDRPFVTWDYFHFMNRADYRGRTLCMGGKTAARAAQFEAYWKYVFPGKPIPALPEPKASAKAE